MSDIPCYRVNLCLREQNKKKKPHADHLFRIAPVLALSCVLSSTGFRIQVSNRSLLSVGQDILTKTLPDLSDATYQHIIWATYDSYYIELTISFVVACLPATRQLIGQKVWPVLSSHISTRTFSISAWTRSRRSSRYGSKNDPEGTKLVSITISAPVDGSFQHLTSHLHPKEPKDSQIGYAL